MLRPFIELSTLGVYERGVVAADTGDDNTVRACLDELAHRVRSGGDYYAGQLREDYRRMAERRALALVRRSSTSGRRKAAGPTENGWPITILAEILHVDPDTLALFAHSRPAGSGVTPYGTIPNPESVKWIIDHAREFVHTPAALRERWTKYLAKSSSKPRKKGPRPQADPAEQCPATAMPPGFDQLEQIVSRGDGPNRRTVYKARRTSNRATVLLKCFAAPEPMRRETAALQRLQDCAGIPKWLAGEVETTPAESWLAATWLNGTNLEHWNTQSRPREQRLAVAVKLLRLVRDIHDRSVLHGDIKPSNVVITAESTDPTPNLIDFGASLLKQDVESRRMPGAIGMTPLYAAPEFLRAPAFESMRWQDFLRGEVFSLAVVLWEILVGSHPLRDPYPVANDRIALAKLYEQATEYPHGKYDGSRLWSRMLTSSLCVQPRRRPGDAVQMWNRVLDDTISV